jgi:F-box and WD-40 domain protein 1/11
MADPLRNGSVPNFAHPFLPLAAFKSAASPMHNAFRLDEGYSEDTRSQAGSEMRADSRMGDLPDPEPSQSLLPDWVLNLTEYERSGKS